MNSDFFKLYQILLKKCCYVKCDNGQMNKKFRKQNMQEDVWNIELVHLFFFSRYF